MKDPIDKKTQEIQFKDDPFACMVAHPEFFEVPSVSVWVGGSMKLKLKKRAQARHMSLSEYVRQIFHKEIYGDKDGN